MMNSNEDNNKLDDNQQSPADTVNALRSPHNRSTRWALRFLLPYSREAVARRETAKSLLIEMTHYIRLVYLKMADILLKEGKLPSRELIFYLTTWEMEEIIKGPSPSLIRKAQKRKKLWPVLQKQKYKEINYGMPKPVENPEIKVTTSDGVKVQGTAVCNGIVTSRACVALTLEEASNVLPGDILITHATDIGWSPYFPMLGGVVTELGGLISHGAVVAREYGLPCIVSAEDATYLFKTGRFLHVFTFFFYNRFQGKKVCF